jgi:hypothetical protein
MFFAKEAGVAHGAVERHEIHPRNILGLFNTDTVGKVVERLLALVGRL